MPFIFLSLHPCLPSFSFYINISLLSLLFQSRPLTRRPTCHVEKRYAHQNSATKAYFPTTPELIINNSQSCASVRANALCYDGHFRWSAEEVAYCLAKMDPTVTEGVKFHNKKNAVWLKNSNKRNAKNFNGFQTQPRISSSERERERGEK